MRYRVILGQLTFTEWSKDEVSILHLGNRPTPTAMSVTGSVWSDRE